MKSNGRLLLKNPRLSGLYLIFIILYILQAILPSPDKAVLVKYGISVAAVKLLGLSVELPYIVIWIIAMLGYLRLKTYAKLIEKDRDGAAFKTISRGLLLLSLWLPVSAVAANYFGQVYRYHPSATAGLTRLNVYLNLVILLVGFWLLYQGAAKLLPLVAKSRRQMLLPMPTLLIYVVLAALYIYLTLHDPARARPTQLVPVASYYEPDWLIVTTTIIPRLVTWLLGVKAIYNIYLYNYKVKGKLYRSALQSLTVGLGGVIATTILLRCLQSLSSPLEHLSLGFLVALVYALLIIMAVGYALVAKGAYNLQQLEET